MSESAPKKEEDRIIHGLTKNNLWAYIDLEDTVQNMEYGNLTITFRIHKREITDVLKQEFRRKRKPTDWNKEINLDEKEAV